MQNLHHNAAYASFVSMIMPGQVWSIFKPHWIIPGMVYIDHNGCVAGHGMMSHSHSLASNSYCCHFCSTGESKPMNLFWRSQALFEIFTICCRGVRPGVQEYCLRVWTSFLGQVQSVLVSSRNWCPCTVTGTWSYMCFS